MYLLQCKLVLEVLFETLRIKLNKVRNCFRAIGLFSYTYRCVNLNVNIMNMQLTAMTLSPLKGGERRLAARYVGLAQTSLLIVIIY